MSSARYDNGSSATYSGTLIDEAGNGIDVADISTLTLTLRNRSGGNTINSRDAQNVLGLNDVAVDANGSITWNIQPADTTIVSGDGSDEHVAQFTWVWTDSGTIKTGASTHTLRCVKYVQLCTFDDVDRGLEDISADDREIVEMLIEAFSARVGTITGRDLELSTKTQYFSTFHGQNSVRLSNYPIVSITTVKQAGDGDFSGASSTIAADSYDILSDGERGHIRFRGSPFSNGVGNLQVVYVGGIIQPLTGVNACRTVPWDLRMAAIRQVSFLYQRRASLGVTSESVGGGSVSLMVEADLLSDVVAVIDSYKPRSVI